MTRDRRNSRPHHRLLQKLTQGLMLLCVSVSAPNSGASQSAPVFEIVIETSKKLPAGAALVVEIRKGQQNFIVLDEATASADELSDAIDAIRQIRARYDDNLPRTIRLVPPRSKTSAANQKNREGSTSFGLLRALKSQKMDRKTRFGKGDELVKRIVLDVNRFPASKAKDIPSLPSR